MFESTWTETLSQQAQRQAHASEQPEHQLNDHAGVAGNEASRCRTQPAGCHPTCQRASNTRELPADDMLST
jgi:hypothetical protein